MVSQAYQLGLLLIVFGGFLSSSSSGEPAGVGVAALFLGLFIGVLGIIHEGLPTRE